MFSFSPKPPQPPIPPAAGTLIALWLMRREAFTAREALAWLRIVRSGCVGAGGGRGAGCGAGTRRRRVTRDNAQQSRLLRSRALWPDSNRFLRGGENWGPESGV